MLILDLPVQFNLEAAMEGVSIPYEWDADYQARIGVLAHEGDPDDVVWCNIDPCFVFHPLNAYDAADGTIIADVVRHPRMFAGRTSLPSGGKPSLVRWVIDPATGSVTESVLSDVPQEFPRVDERVVGKKHRYGYGVYSSKESTYAGAIKHDLEAGTSEWRRYGPGRTCQEPVFVPRHATAEEDDGWLLAYVHNEATGTTDIEVWESPQLHRRAARAGSS
ncbi:MAG: carotenoid oxygenase family protein [Acidimicrobiales bacterium]